MPGTNTQVLHHEQASRSGFASILRATEYSMDPTGDDIDSGPRLEGLWIENQPSVSIDRLAIQRESWRFPPTELEFAHVLDPAQRFLRARNWAHAHRIPRFVFFKVPVEKKPAFLDFESPILLNMFVKAIRCTLHAALPGPVIEISEMLPATQRLWLADAHNQRYTVNFVSSPQIGAQHKNAPEVPF